MQKLSFNADAGQMSGEMTSGGISAAMQAYVVVIAEELPAASLARADSAFDWLSEEPDLYSDADLVQRNE